MQNNSSSNQKSQPKVNLNIDKSNQPIKEIQKYLSLSDQQTQPRFTGIPSFFRTAIVQNLQQLSLVDIGIIGVPFDLGVTNRSGARHGPREVRNQSCLLRKVNTSTRAEPFEFNVCDLGDAWIEQPYVLETALNEIQAFYKQVINADVIPLSVGGDHSIALPILRAVGAKEPLGMVHIDAHSDTGDDYMGSRFHHGSPFRRAVEEGLLDPKRVVQIGIRGTAYDSAGLWNFSSESGMRVIPMDQVVDNGYRWVIEQARAVVGNGPTYLSFDIDSLDPTFAPGTGTPEAGGLTIIEAQRIVRGMMGVDFRGADLVEVCPPFDNGTITAFNAASMLFEILCVLGEALRLRKVV